MWPALPGQLLSGPRAPGSLHKSRVYLEPTGIVAPPVALSTVLCAFDFCALCLILRVLLYEAPPTCWLERQERISHRAGGWEVWDQGAT